MRIALDLPPPPPINRLWRSRRSPKTGKPIVYLSPRYVSWQKQFGLHWQIQRPRGFKQITEDFQATIIIGGRRRDADASAKALLDALQKFEIIKNDSQCIRVISEYGPTTLGCRLIIETQDGA
jgi:Holliday junction resolvase RusA-like endonuclease